jgi:hypothetical protein
LHLVNWPLHVYSPTKTIDRDILISLVSEEYERQRTSRARRNPPLSSRPRENDEAMAVNPPRKRKAGNSRCDSHKKTRSCWNCGEEGHFQRNCPKPKKDAKPAGSDSAHVAQESDDEAFGVSDTDSMPDLESVSDSSVSSEDVRTDPDSMPDLQTVSRSSDSDSMGASLDMEDNGED